MAGLEMNVGHGVSLSTHMRPSAELVRVAHVLSLSATELGEMIDEELAENPALEAGPPEEDFVWQWPERATAVPAAPEPAYRPSPLEELWRELAPHVAEADKSLARYLIGSLDPQGRLDDTPARVAARLDVAVERVETVLSQIQAIAPPGVGARDARESLLLQLRALAGEEPADLAARIVERHASALCDGDVDAIAAAERVGVDRVREALEFVRRRARPFGAVDGELPGWAAGPPDCIVPSVRIRRDARDELRVDVLEPRRHPIALSPSYECGLDAAARWDRSHVEVHRRRAQDFLAQVRQRWKTLQSISECVVRRQEAYVRHGPRHLARLTRAEVAAEVGVHESTVSRATSNKYVVMPDRSVVAFHTFFTTSLPVLQALERLVREERTPRNDNELALALRACGHDVARRTVAKYRGLLGIPPSSRRAPGPTEG